MTNPTTSVVIDANVALAAGTMEFLLHVAAATDLRLRWSTGIWDEVERHLAERHPKAAERSRAALGAVDDALIAVDEVDSAAAAGHADPKDEHVLAAALAERRIIDAEAAGDDRQVLLLTNNLGDFDRACASELGVRVLSPDELGIELVETVPEALFSFISTEPEGYFDGYLERMARAGMTMTASALRAAYDEAMADDE